MSLRTVADDTCTPDGPHDVRGPHRLGGVDVLLHDGPEDGGLAFVEHQGPGTRCYRVPARRSRFRAWQGGADAVRRGGCRSGRRGRRRAPGPARARRRAGRARARTGPPSRPTGCSCARPTDEVRVPVPVRRAPARARRSAHDDVVLLAVKGQDTPAALDALADGPPDLAVACLQNGVDNERQVLRRTPEHLRRAGDAARPPTSRPGVVDASSAPVTGILDVGRYPTGVDDRAEAISAAFASSTFSSVHQPDRDAVQVVEAPHEPRQRARGGRRADRPGQRRSTPRPGRRPRR